MQSAKCRIIFPECLQLHFRGGSREMRCIAEEHLYNHKNVESDFKQMVARQTRNPLAQFTNRK